MNGDAFIAAATAAASTVTRLQSRAEVPAAAAAWLHREGLPAELYLAPDPQVATLPWDTANGLALREPPLPADGAAVLTGCAGALAEAGALVFASSPAHPAELNFLAETQLVLLAAVDIVADFEALWRLPAFAAGGPRQVNLVTGPSRTADLGVPSRLGAHGPARLQIFLIDK